MRRVCHSVAMIVLLRRAADETHGAPFSLTGAHVSPGALQVSAVAALTEPSGTPAEYVEGHTSTVVTFGTRERVVHLPVLANRRNTEEFLSPVLSVFCTQWKILVWLLRLIG